MYFPWLIFSSGSEFVNVAIIAPRDEARSRDDDRFEFASNKFRSSFFDRFGQKIHQKIRLDANHERSRFARMIAWIDTH
jgi:hypothetical protein